MKNNIDDSLINHNKSHIIGIWNISEPRQFSWWLHNGVSIPRGQRFNSQKYAVRKILIRIYFYILVQSLEELMPVMVSQ